jgi:hypothetical protein
MKKALLALGIGAVSFLVGLIGFVFVLPSVAPERAEEAKLYLDSLEAVQQGHVFSDSTSHEDSTHATNEHGETADTLHGEETPVRDISDAPDKHTTPAEMPPALKDSLASMRQRIQTLHTENQSLRRQLDEARKSTQTRATRASDVAGLTETLTKLDDKELRPILQQLDGDVLEQLYKSTSGRTQARLLKAMPADRAAGFVQNLVRGTSAAGTTQKADSSTPE